MRASALSARILLGASCFGAARIVHAGTGTSAAWAAQIPMLQEFTGDPSGTDVGASGEVLASTSGLRQSVEESVGDDAVESTVLLRSAEASAGPVSRAAPAAGASSQGKSSASTSVSSCVDNAMKMAKPLLSSLATPGSQKARDVDGILRRIKSESSACADRLFTNGTAAHPNAGLLTGNGFSFTARSCAGSRACAGGNAGALLGNGGHGFNGGAGGNAGWYGGTAGNGGDAAVVACSSASCLGGPGGRAGRYGRGGAGGDGAPGFAGGAGGTGGLIGGAGGNGGNGGDGANGGAGGAGGDAGAGRGSVGREGAGGNGGDAGAPGNGGKGSTSGGNGGDEARVYVVSRLESH